MSHASLKEQLQALASQLPGTQASEKKPDDKKPNDNKPRVSAPQRKRHQPAEKANKRPKPKWLEHAQYGVELLRAYFPNCFKLQSEVKPLKKGIKQDLVKRLSSLNDIVTEDKACMVKSLAYYVNTTAYHKSVIEGTGRVDLDGQPAGVVSAEEAAYSTERNQSRLNKKRTPAPAETETA